MITHRMYVEQAQSYANAYCDEETFKHTSLVVRFALELAAEYGADAQVVEIAAWLHDIGRVDTSKGHAQRSVELSEKLLAQHPKKELITECILKHGKDHIDEKNPVEIKVMQASDSLATLFDDERLAQFLIEKGEETYKKMLTEKHMAKTSVLPTSKKRARKRIEELLNRLPNS